MVRTRQTYLAREEEAAKYRDEQTDRQTDGRTDRQTDRAARLNAEG